MTKIPTPDEQAAANLGKRKKAEEQQKAAQKQRAKEDLLALCLEEIADYDGTAAVWTIIDPSLAVAISDVESEMKGWALYLSVATPGKLFIGTPLQIELIRVIDVGPPAIDKERLVRVPRAPVGDEPVKIRPLTQGDPEQPVRDEPVEIQPLPKTTAAAPASHTFWVCDVSPESGRLPVMSGDDAFRMLLKTPVEAFDTGEKKLVSAHGFHALVETAHVAFAQHYGLELSPDDIWQTIVQGFARIVAEQPEQFRTKFVTHQGTELIEIRRDTFIMGNPDNDWPGCFDEFNARIRERIGATNHDLLISNYSTTGAVERAASNVAVMDTVQSYFRYSVATLCGIPFVTLHGSVEDWQALATKVRRLAEYGDLGWWLNDVIPIVDQFVAAASGKVDKDFWNSIYKSRESSGGINITGWLLKLIPLLRNYKNATMRNPLLGEPNCKPHQTRRSKLGYGSSRDADLDGDETISTGLLPASLSTVPFIWKYFDEEHKYQFVAGIVGYTHNETNGALRPQMGWAVRPEPKADETKSGADGRFALDE